LRIHSGKKPFDCPWDGCGYACATSGRLRAHLRVHSGKRPFDCPREGCGYASATSGNLRVHLRVHSGEKPFLCFHEGCGYSFAQSGSLARHVRRCATAGSVVRLRKDCTSSGASSGRARTRANSPSCFRNREAGKPLPVTTQPPPLTVSTTAAARLSSEADLNLAPDWQRQSTGVSSDSPRSGATVFSGVCERFDREQVPSDRQEPGSPGLNLSPAPTPAVAQLEWEQWSSATGGMSDWIPWSTDHNLFEGWPPLCSSSVSDLEAPSSLLADDDKAFWQALISPAHGEQ